MKYEYILCNKVLINQTITQLKIKLSDCPHILFSSGKLSMTTTQNSSRAVFDSLINFWRMQERSDNNYMRGFKTEIVSNDFTFKKKRIKENHSESDWQPDFRRTLEKYFKRTLVQKPIGFCWILRLLPGLLMWLAILTLRRGLVVLCFLAHVT